ncbi:MAG: hypothetical protein FWH33_03460 [Oscillospiraceae bacterium]|nr:hypothetical protein [Oscillospiraceae bacterium]
MLNDVKTVENPVYMELDEIKRQYWGCWLLLCNIAPGEGIKGGIVRYYADKRTGLYEKMREIDKSPEIFGETTVFFVGNKGNTLGGLSL